MKDMLPKIQNFEDFQNYNFLLRMWRQYIQRNDILHLYKMVLSIVETYMHLYNMKCKQNTHTKSANEVFQ